MLLVKKREKLLIREVLDNRLWLPVIKVIKTNKKMTILDRLREVGNQRIQL